MDELTHIEKTIAAATDTVVADAITYVRSHPQYGQIVQSLGEQAIAALLKGL